MLLKRISLYLLPSFVILIILFNNCTKESNDNLCGCTSDLDDFVNSNYVIANNNSSLLIEGKHKTYDGNYQITLGTIDDANKLQNHFTKARNTDDSVYTIVLYCNKVFGTNDTIIDSDVVGVSIYCVSDSNLIHSIFVKDSILEMDLIHSYTTRIINLSDVDFIFNNIIKITGDKSYVLVTPDNEVDFTTNRSYDNFLTVKYQYLNLSGNTKSTLENPGGNQCPSPCPIAFYNMSCYNGLPGDPVYCA